MSDFASAPSRGCKLLHLIQIAAVIIATAYLGSVRGRLSRRNKQSWESLLAKLQPNWGGRESSEHYLWMEGLTVTPDEIWSHMHGGKGLWTIFKNAGVMREMAEYASRNCDTVDRLLIETLLADATQIRICALNGLVQCAVNRASEGVRINAFRAASMYTGMTARMQELVRQNAPLASPEFIAAM